MQKPYPKSMIHGVKVISKEMVTDESHSLDVSVSMIGEVCVFSSIGILVRFMIIVSVSFSSVVVFARAMVHLKSSSCLMLILW